SDIGIAVVATSLARRQWTARLSAGRRRLPASCEHLQLKDRFKKSLSMSGEVGSLAGVGVVSHERSRLADLPRRQGLWSRHARPLSFGLLWLRLLVCSSGRRSSPPEGCDLPEMLIRSFVSSFSASIQGQNRRPPAVGRTPSL